MSSVPSKRKRDSSHQDQVLEEQGKTSLRSSNQASETTKNAPIDVQDGITTPQNAHGVLKTRRIPSNPLFQTPVVSQASNRVQPYPQLSTAFLSLNQPTTRQATELTGLSPPPSPPPRFHMTRHEKTSQQGPMVGDALVSSPTSGQTPKQGIELTNHTHPSAGQSLPHDYVVPLSCYPLAAYDSIASPGAVVHRPQDVSLPDDPDPQEFTLGNHYNWSHMIAHVLWGAPQPSSGLPLDLILEVMKAAYPQCAGAYGERESRPPYDHSLVTPSRISHHAAILIAAF
ncbi:hypothetical protein DL93DRAFT_2224366 [Clavulina sp. PMI_390]|nr:hypothetical protein DL93DRAFT_2224366 [Clavulina sp. PMI_390]